MVTASTASAKSNSPLASANRSTSEDARFAIVIGHGKSNAEIGRDLYMSIATVKAHVSRLLEKLKFNNRVQIALLAHDAGEA